MFVQFVWILVQQIFLFYHVVIIIMISVSFHGFTENYYVPFVNTGF